MLKVKIEYPDFREKVDEFFCDSFSLEDGELSYEEGYALNIIELYDVNFNLYVEEKKLRKGVSKCHS